VPALVSHGVVAQSLILGPGTYLVQEGFEALPGEGRGGPLGVGWPRHRSHALDRITGCLLELLDLDPDPFLGQIAPPSRLHQITLQPAHPSQLFTHLQALGKVTIKLVSRCRAMATSPAGRSASTLSKDFSMDTCGPRQTIPPLGQLLSTPTLISPDQARHTLSISLRHPASEA
jgi:hypothetical protein